jgi:hypothetical protein
VCPATTVARPAATIQIGTCRWRVRAVLSPAEGAEVMSGYARRHPRAAKALSGLMGFGVDGGEQDYRAVGREIPFVRLMLIRKPS